MTASGLRQRLAAILAADAAGFSRLMAADERATVEALDAARAVFGKQIEAHQGRVIDMAGDSVLAVFDLASGAIAAALAIQQELDAASGGVHANRRMRFRIGVHLGTSHGRMAILAWRWPVPARETRRRRRSTRRCG